MTVFFSVVWGGHILREVYAAPNTLWQDFVAVLQDAKQWDPAGVTLYFARDRVVSQVKLSTTQRFVGDWQNTKNRNKKRCLQSMGLTNGCMVEVVLGRA